LVWYKLGDNICKKSEYVMSLGIGKTLYQSNMDFNTKAHIRGDTLVYPYILYTKRIFILKGKANNKEIQKLATIWNWKLKIGNNIKHRQKIGYFRNLKGDLSPNNKDTTQCNKICTYQNTKQKWTPSKVRTKCKCNDKLDSCTILHINL
jgi:hypothetical protein